MRKEKQVLVKNTFPKSNWLKVLEENHVRSMALDPCHDHNLIHVLNSDTSWIIEFENEDSVFFVRQEAHVDF